MPKSAPICRYCDRTYSKINEPIYMVCYCNETIKYAHGSCFRNWLKDYKYGVCDECLTKTKIVPEEYKNISRWRVPQSQHKVFGIFHTIISVTLLIAFIAILIWWQATQCYEAYCIALFVVFMVLLLVTLIYGYFSKRVASFWFDFCADNKYWKIVYCREVLRKTNSNNSIRRLSNVPMSLSDIHENETKVDLENGITSCAFEMGESNVEFQDSVFQEENIFVDHIFSPHKEWTPKSHLRIKKQQIHITDTFYASQSKRYLKEKLYDVDIDPELEDKPEENIAMETQSHSNVGKTLSDLENEMWQSSELQTENKQEKGIVDDYIKSRADRFFNRRSSEVLSPSDEYIMELRNSNFGSNSSVNSQSDSRKTLPRSASIPIFNSDLFFEKKQKMSRTALFKKDRRSKFKRHRSLTSIEVTINQEFTFDSYYTRKSRSATSLVTASEKDFRHLDNQVKERSRSVESVTSIKSRETCTLDETFTQEKSNPMFSDHPSLNTAGDWRSIPRIRDMAMTLTSLPYKKVQNQDVLDTYKTFEEKEIYNEKRVEQSSKISEQFENDPRKVLQQFQKDFEKSMTQKIDYDLGVYQIGPATKSSRSSTICNGTIQSEPNGLSYEVNDLETNNISDIDLNGFYHSTSNHSRPSFFNSNGSSPFFEIDS